VNVSAAMPTGRTLLVSARVPAIAASPRRVEPPPAYLE
jgi:hypothetical protein